MKKHMIWMILTIVLLTAACGNVSSENSIDGEWVLVTLDSSPVLPDYPITLTIEDGEVSGRGSCNIYSGELSLDGETLIIGPIASTEMACADEAAMQQETDYYAALNTVNKYQTTDDNKLFFLGKDDTVRLIFVPVGTLVTSEASEVTDPVSAEATDEPTPVPVVNPPENFKPYQDLAAGVSVYIPESWTVTGIVEGQTAVLQSYPEDKYVGGEPFEPQDTKCDLTIRPSDIDMNTHITELKSDSMITILSEETISLNSGQPATRLEIDSMGLSTSAVTEINDRVVVLTCFGERTPFDEIALTLAAVD